MRIAHVGVWVPNLDQAAAFWSEHFGASIGPLYRSQRRVGFESRFVQLPGSEVAIELMAGPWVQPAARGDAAGWAHVAISLGSEEEVIAAACRFDAHGLLLEGPRRTGDGFFEALVRAPDGTLVELTG